MNRSVRNLIALLGLTTLMLGLGAVPAFAGPALQVTLERDSAAFPTVYHSDERVDFTARVNNVASKTESVAVGTVLTCDPNESRWSGEPIFTFKWLSSGVQVGTGPTYEVQPADAGNLLQCLVVGENSGGASVSFTLPLQVVPMAAPAPPAYSGSGQPRPEIDFEAASVGSEITCTAPTSWTGSPSWTFEWLRNGSPANGEVTATTASSSTYKVAAADVPGALQCVAIAATGSGAPPSGGTAVSISTVKATLPEPSPFPPMSDPFNNFPSYEAFLPFIVDPNATAGPVTVEVELPSGNGTFAFKTEPDSWSCEEIPASGGEHARVVCNREDALLPGAEYPPLEVITGLGADAPDIAIANARAFGGSATAGSDDLTFPIAPAIPFGISKFVNALINEVGGEDTQAGGHPFADTSEVVLNRKRALTPIDPATSLYVPIAQTRQIIVDLPPGVVGNPLAIPELCSEIEEVKKEICPLGSLVGELEFVVPEAGGKATPIYAIEPEFGAPVQFAFRETGGRIIVFTPRLRPDDGYGVSLEVSPSPEVNLLEARVRFCGFGRIGLLVFGCKAKGDPGANPKPLFTNPTRCGVPLSTGIRLNSWSDPTFVEGPPFANGPITGCDEVPFEPKADLQPTSHQADSPTGFDVELTMPTQGLEEPDGISQSNLRAAKVTLPEGMAVNPTAAMGLDACSADQIKLGTNVPISCPQASKIGTVEVETPLIGEALKGAVYVAKQGDVEGSLVGFYLVFDSPKNGILIKQPAKVTPDPITGQLVVTVAENPEQPFSAVRMHFPGGPRATLLTPPRCGTYQITSELTPWSGGVPVTEKSNFDVSEGPDGSPCPSGALQAQMGSGSVDATAGRTSPFFLRLHREDGSQRFAALDLHMPPGLTAYLKGVPYCSGAVLAAIPSAEGTGREQIANPSCPAASRIGQVVVGAGAGPDPLYVDTGRVYLAGPYKGAPLSIAVVAPAVAGPLDLGNVVVRSALRLDPESAQVSVLSDPIPTILHGILLDVRDIRISIDRGHFTLNPTSCEPMSVEAEAKGQEGGSASLSNHFQVRGCGNLKFAPKLSVRLFGGTRRSAYPRLRATLEAKPGQANLARASVALPHSEFLAQEHIRTVCTRVQFAAQACPPGSVYGRATAITPLLDQPISGPVYLRSSSHELPDLVVDLRGPAWQPLETVVVGRIDSRKGQIRTTFENAPDVPLTKFTLQMQGGKKGLLVNSRNICASTNRATAAFEGHNGKSFESRPMVKNGKCKKASRHRSKHRPGR